MLHYCDAVVEATDASAGREEDAVEASIVGMEVASMMTARMLVEVLPQVSVATSSIVSVATLVVSMRMLLTSAPLIHALYPRLWS